MTIAQLMFDHRSAAKSPHMVQAQAALLPCFWYRLRASETDSSAGKELISSLSFGQIAAVIKVLAVSSLRGALND